MQHLRQLMKVGDLVSAEYYGNNLIGFIMAIDPDRHEAFDTTFYFVRFPAIGKGMWYEPSKLTIISESSVAYKPKRSVK